MQNTGFLTEVVEGGLLLGRKLNTFFSVTLTQFLSHVNFGLHFMILTLEEMWGGGAYIL